MKRLIFIIIILPMLTVAQHSMKGTFSPVEDFENVILYKVTPTASLYVAHTTINQGELEILLDSTITAGMYRLVYALPQEEFNFDIIYNAKEDIEFTFNSETGIEYQSSNENKLIASYTSNMSLLSGHIGDFYREQRADSLALELLFNAQGETQFSFEEAAKETIALHFIKANRPYVPESYESIEIYIQNLKTHFFDHVDFNNEVLQSSNFLIERTLNYVFGMSSESGDDVTQFKKNIDDLCVAMKNSSPEIKATLLELLWQQMVDTGFEEVANYISETYLIVLAKSLNDQELINGLELFKSLSIGNIAPDFQIQIEENNTKVTNNLSDLNTAENYIVVFWSNTCAHCLKEIPLLQRFVNEKEKGELQVIAIGLEDEPFGWRKETLKYPEVIHVLGFGKWDNEIGNSYNVTSTPTYFVLDKDKKIMAKPYDFEALKKILN
jgi:thiol-disulfide isomerase/thioredoxin